MDETAVGDDQYDDVNETINHENVVTEPVVVENVAVGDAAANDVAAAGDVADLGAAADTAGVNPPVQPPPVNPIVIEQEKQQGRDDLLNLVHQENAARFRSSTEFHAHIGIDPEDPSTVPDEVLSEDDNEDNSLALDENLLDPEKDLNKEVVTLGAHYPGMEPSQEALDKDPVLNPREVEGYTGIVDKAQIDGILQYYQALSHHKRKIYLHASELKKEIKARAFQTAPHYFLKELLERAENSKFYLDRIHEKLNNLFPLRGGQKTSKTRSNNNLEENIVFLKRATALALQLEVEEARDQALRAQQDLNDTQAQLNAMRTAPNLGKGKPNVHPIPPAQPQKPATSTPTRFGVNPPGHQPAGANFNPSGSAQGFSFGAGGASRTGPGNSHNFGYGGFTWSQQGRGGTRGGRGNIPQGRGGFGGSRQPGQSGNGSQGFQDQPDPPFRPQPGDDPGYNPHVSPGDRQFATILAQAIRSGLRQDDKPNYRGIEKPKIDFFDGDVSKYRQWKSAFELMYTPDRNLPDDFLATALIGLLKGEARKSVLVHVTANWDGTDYKAMWEHLDRRYGSQHVQARCIRDKANQILYLDTLSLKAVLAFYEAVTVQFKYYLTEQPHAVQDANSHLFISLKEKMSDKIVDKYIDYLDSDSHDEPLPRTVETLLRWLEKTISRLQEVKITSKSSKLRTSQSPRRVVNHGSTETEDVVDMDIDDASDYDSDTDPNHTINKTTVGGERVHFNFKKNKYFKPKRFPGEMSTTTFANSNSQVAPILKPKFGTKPVPSKNCYLCETVEHELVNCKKFAKLPVSQRYTAVARSGSCYHCLKRGHRISECRTNPRVS